MIAVAIEEQKIRVLFDRVQWRFAKSMPKIPHWYTRRGDWQSEEEFEWAVSYIRNNGVKEYFGRKEFTYLYIDGFKHWTMGSPIKKTILINRAKK